MKPITFACVETIPLPAGTIANNILDLENWLDFEGCGPIPGIKSAEFEVRTPEVIGTRICVTNKDGSGHTEEIVEWDPSRRVVLRFGDFSKPLSGMANYFLEWWEFQPADSSDQSIRAGHSSPTSTRVTRGFELHAKSLFSRAMLWMVSFYLKKAIARHLRQMREAALLKVTK